jgi:hypothetical protein
MALQQNFNITLDLKKQIAVASQIPTFIQNDTSTLFITLMDNGKAYDFASADRYVINMKRPDGKIITGLATYDTETQKIKYNFGSTEMELAGNLEVSISLFLGESRISTRPFMVRILKDYEEGIPSEEGYSALQELFIEVDTVKSTAQEKAQYAQQQGDYAKAKAENFTHKGNYDTTKSYKNGNVVTYGGVNYFCIQDTTVGVNPLNGSYWSVVSPSATFNEQTWVAGSNQKTFTITNGQYVPTKGNIQVFVGGVPQVSGVNFTESSETTISFSEAVPTGVTVYAKWMEGALSITKGHKTGHEAGGQDELDVTKLKNFKENVTDQFTSVSSQLADNMQRSEQYQGDLLELVYRYSGLKDKVIVRYRNEGGVNCIDVGVFFNQSNATIFTFKPDQDGWYRLKDTTKRKINIAEAKLTKNYTSTTGAWNTSAAPNHYTTEVGATFTGTFYGTGCYLQTYANNQGGIWEITVDGIYTRQISTWSAAIVNPKVHPLFTGLPEGEHTIVGVFKGDDPEHAPSGGTGTSRGWLKYAVGSQDAGIGYFYKNITQEAGIYIMELNSRKEFAFACKPASYGGGNVWVPEHDVLTVMRNISYKIFFGTREVTSLSAEHTDYRFYDNVKITTEFDAYHPSATTLPMWHGRIDQTIDGKGVHIKGHFDFKQDTFIGNAYPAMIAIDKAFTKNNMVVDSYGNRYELPWDTNDESDIIISSDPFCIAHFCKPSLLPGTVTTPTNAQRDNVVVMRIWNANKSMRLNENNRGDVFVRLRTDGDRKTYYNAFKNHTALAGETYDFGHTWFIGEIYEADKVLP